MPRKYLLFLIPVLIIFFSSNCFSQAVKKDTDWKPWHFIIGDWVGEGGGKPGQGVGSFSFDFDLQKRILVRKSNANYPAEQNKPAYSHNDLMVIYKEASSSTEAMYFDNEGHVIKYSVKFSDDQNSIIFTSIPAPNQPVYRLTYTKVNNQKLNIKFEIAPHGSPGGFSTYIQATAHRK
jgi:uncharacterized protein YkuJ